MTTDIDNAQDILDSRDVTERLEELQAEVDAGDLPEDDEEFVSLKAFAEEAEGYANDWHYGATLIRDSYFRDYAEELADDIGAINRDASWPLCHIDWDAAADSLKQDYSSVEWGGVSYWVR